MMSGKQPSEHEMSPPPEGEQPSEVASTTPEQAPAQVGESPASGETASPDLVSLQSMLEETRLTAAEYLDGWQRSMAEFANYKKRQEREREQVFQSAVGSVVKRYLEIVDDLERALKKRPLDGEGAAWAEGVELIYRKLLATLDAEGVEVMDALGQPFDPTRHEAIGQVDSPDHQSGQIVEVVQQGYLIGDRVLRPALVRIAL
jgi:molecular chaperone GrpE